MPRGEQFLDKKYTDLRTSEPVEHEARRRQRAGETEQKKPHEKIEDFLDVLKQTHGHRDDPRVLERIKHYYHKQHVINPEDIPDSYFQSQGELAVVEGRQGDLERAGVEIETQTITNRRGEETQKRVFHFPEEYKTQLSEVIIADQRSSLDNWVDYLSSPDADAYPMWAKYWAFRSMLGLSTFDKEKHRFNKRRKDTVAPFPDLNREALAYVVDIITKKVEGADIQELEDNPELQKVLQTENFGKLYAYAIEKVTPVEEAELQDTRGQWITYPKGSDHMPLVATLQGHGTSWCTAGESTARAQLDVGDLHVYYSLDKDGKPIVPRVAIRMEGNRIAEVRGIAHEQNLDPNITPVVEEKLKSFGKEGEKYHKRSADMKKLTTIELKIKTGKPLDKGDLIFLYEVDGPIEGFGYQRDPRISELRDRRDRRADLATIFDYTPEQIAFSEDEVNERSKAYVGPIFPGVFSYENLEQVYTKFPEWKRGIYKIRIGDKTPQELESIVSGSNNAGGRTALSMLKSEEFASANRDVRDIDVVIVTRKDLGFTKEPREKRDSPSLNEVYQRAAIFGLEPCPATTAPYLAIALSAKSESYREYGDVISVASDHWIMSEKIGIDAKRDKLPSPLQFYIGPGGMSAGGPTFPTERGLALGHFAFQRKKTEAGISTIAEQKPPGIPEIIVEYFQKKLESKYGPLERDEKDRIGDYLFKLNKTFGGLEELGSERIGERGKRILDIGCGSTLSKYAKELPTSDSERIRSRQYEPWLPRILKELDADPVGIDIGNLEGEQFEHYQLNLTQPGVLDFLPDHSFYAINMWGFLDSPVLRLSRERKKQLLEELEQQKKRLLKEGGRTILWDVEY